MEELIRPPKILRRQAGNYRNSNAQVRTKLRATRRLAKYPTDCAFHLYNFKGVPPVRQPQSQQRFVPTLATVFEQDGTVPGSEGSSSGSPGKTQDSVQYPEMCCHDTYASGKQEDFVLEAWGIIIDCEDEQSTTASSTPATLSPVSRPDRTSSTSSATQSLGSCGDRGTPACFHLEHAKRTDSVNEPVSPQQFSVTAAQHYFSDPEETRFKTNYCNSSCTQHHSLAPSPLRKSIVQLNSVLPIEAVPYGFPHTLRVKRPPSPQPGLQRQTASSIATSRRYHSYRQRSVQQQSSKERQVTPAQCEPERVMKPKLSGQSVVPDPSRNLPTRRTPSAQKESLSRRCLLRKRHVSSSEYARDN